MAAAGAMAWLCGNPIFAPAAGTVPEQRGHGYGYDLLAECTHFLAAEGAEFIAGATDRGNIPMAAAFARAGHRISQERVHLV